MFTTCRISNYPTFYDVTEPYENKCFPHECSVFHKSLAEKLSIKKNERYSETIQYIRVKLSYMALRSSLLCIRGSRSIKQVKQVSTDIEDFSLVLGEMGLQRSDSVH